MTGTLTRICRTGLVSSIVAISFITMTYSMTLDLTDLRNNVSKIKVNPRGNLWASGHFMGKKSVESVFSKSSFGEVPISPAQKVENRREHIQQLLKIALNPKLNCGDQMTGLPMKLLRNAI